MAAENRTRIRDGATARYRIEQEASALVVELTEVAGKQEELLEAFGECQSGRFSCPTNEYEKLAAIEVQPGEEQITLRLQTKPGLSLASSEIAACLDHTVAKLESDRYYRTRRAARGQQRIPLARSDDRSV